MKRLVYFITWAFSSTASTQSYPVKNVNLDYVVSTIYTKNISITDLADIKQDNNGLHWFQTSEEVFSFDGVKKRSYKFRSPFNNTIPFKINGIEILEDNTILVATENGMYVFDKLSESFVWIEEKYPSLRGMPLAVSCFYKVIKNKILFNSALTQGGFFILDWEKKTFKYHFIDSAIKASIPYGEPVYVTSDNNGNIWGVIKDKGIWNYNESTEKILRSWKKELPYFLGIRFSDITSVTYSAADNTLWVSHSKRKYLEKINLQNGKSFFYCFKNDLEVHADTSAKNNYPVFHVKIDGNKNEWVDVNGKYLVKLNQDIRSFEYISNDKGLLDVGDWSWFKPEDNLHTKTFSTNNILLWTSGIEKLSMIKKRLAIVRHIPFDTSEIAGVHPTDYTNPDAHKNIFFEKGKNDQYFLLQQDEDRPKFICFDKNLKIKKVLFNDKWKQYPAFFSQNFNADTFYIAFMRTDYEPLNLRKVIIKEFKVDINTFKVEETDLSFNQRVWHYGYADADNVYWLFSNGNLYSYDPQKNILDSIYVCEPWEKRSYPLELIKGYDYPTVLHKNTSTFWIDFIPARQIYKINLKTRKIDKVFNCCLNRSECKIPGGIFDMYNFDTTNIYLQQSFSALLINAKNNFLTTYSDLFNTPASQTPSGSGVYNNWVCFVLASHIYLLNKATGIQKQLTLNEDFKWPISQFNSRPLVNDHNKMILMSSQNKGFVVFDLDSISTSEKPGDVQISFISLDNKLLPVDSLLNVESLKVKFNKYNSIQIAFSDNSVFDPSQIKYEYTLYKDGDTTWNYVDGKPELTLSQLSAGDYQLLLRAKNKAGVLSTKITSLNITVLPPFWQTLGFKGLIIVVIGLLFYGLYRYRVQQLKKLQAIRNNIASDLHDDIGSTLNSISIYSEVAKQQAGKEIPALDMIGMNSRKIIESMSDIVWTINPENDSFEKIIIRMRSFAHQLLKAKKVEYTFEVDDKMNKIVLPMQVRKNFYLVFKEAITNVVKYSEASRVSISLFENNKVIMLRVRDNGKGIPINAETQGNGLLNMNKRAAEIKAELNIISSNGSGTEIKLMLEAFK